MFTLADRSVSPHKYSHAAHALSLSLPDLISVDGHPVNLAISLVVRLTERPADIAVFDEHFSAAPRASLDDVRQYLADALRGTAASHVASKTAAECLDAAAALQAAMLEKLNAIGFGCGLEMLPPMTLETSSDSLAAERIAAATTKRQAAVLERAAALREQIASGAAAHLSPTDLAAMLPTLLQSESPATGRLLLAAGPAAIEITLPKYNATASTAPDPVGALRSIQAVTIDGRLRLACGGQRGVALLDVPGEAPAQVFLLNHISSSRGFNAIGFDASQRQIVATHGEFGIVRWVMDSAAPPLVSSLPGARLLTILDDRLLLASGGDVIAVASSPKTVASGEGHVIAILNLDESIGIVRTSGNITRLDRTTLQPLSDFDHPATLRCAALLRVAGMRLLLLGTEAGVIDVVTFAGQPVGHVRPRAGVSLLTSSGATIAALSADRATVEIFAGGVSATMINLVARFGHRATDLVTASARD